MFWLLHEDTLRRLREAHESVKVSAEEQRLHIEREEREAAERRGPRSLRLAGDRAEIRVEGVLTKRPDIWAWLMGLGNTAYVDLLEAIASARSNADVKAVQLVVDSPGGSADGLFDVLAALEQLRAEKPVSVKAANAFSAAYGIAAAAGPIEAKNAGSMFGSVGVAVRYAQWADVDVVDLTNTESPDKRPDVHSEAGRAVVRRELDAIFDLFVEAIASGRRTSKQSVIENFGRGASFVARDAQSRGMIDTISGPALRALPGGLSAEQPEPAPQATAQEHGGNSAKETRMSMDLKTFRTEHPDLYQEVFEAGREKGVADERDRVGAHLTLGTQGGARGIQIAHAAISAGDGMTATKIAEYQVVMLNERDQAARQRESDAAGAAADGAAPPGESATGATGDGEPSSDDATYNNAVLARMEQRRGIKRKAG